MKIKNIISLLIVCGTYIGVANANTTDIETLNKKKAQLESKIKTEDAKRNDSINGVSPQTMEEINIKQDSICLELRSQLLQVNIQIKEVKKQNLTNVVNSAANKN